MRPTGRLWPQGRTFWLLVVVWLAAGVAGVLEAQSPGASEPGRIALVIGNSAYLPGGIWPDLAKGPQQDATLMRKALTDLKFDVVYAEDANRSQMLKALDDFRVRLQKHPGALALVYFSGHGAQASVRRDDGGLDIENFLIPSRTGLRKESDAPDEAISQGRVENFIRAGGASTGVIILDACRDNGLERDLKSGSIKSLAGLQETGMLIVYAAQSGKWAYNADSGPSVFTRTLAREMTSQASFTLALYRVHDQVMEATRGLARGAQEPEIRASIGHDIRLADAVAVTPPLPAPKPPECAVCPEMVAIRPGTFQMGSPDSEEGRDADEGPVHPVNIRYSFEVSMYPITRGQWRQYLTASGRAGSGNCYGFDGKSGFDRKPEYSWKNPGFPQEDNHPAVCVTWKETQEYVAWLNQQSGHHYRLLTEAEYEYVNRAESSTAYPWGPRSEDQCKHANGADSSAKSRFPGWTTASCSDGSVFTSPVGSFPANAFGLYDVSGNVWTWTQDCYHDTYKGAPADGSAWEGGADCARRVVRGGAWGSLPRGLRSARRLGGDDSDVIVGFRLARTT